MRFYHFQLHLNLKKQKGQILEVYKILGYSNDAIENDRIAFELEEIESDLRGKTIVTKTSNPCTIIENLEFK